MARKLYEDGSPEKKRWQKTKAERKSAVAPVKWSEDEEEFLLYHWLQFSYSVPAARGRGHV